MLLRYAILGLLDGRELHGYRIKSVFEDRIGPTWSLNFGQIYQTYLEAGILEQRVAMSPVPRTHRSVVSSSAVPS